MQLSSCATSTLWKKTDSSGYIIFRFEDISEQELQKNNAKYIKNEQAGVFYVERSNIDKFTNYTVRTFGTPVTVVFDAAIIVVLAYSHLTFGGFYKAKESDDEKSLNKDIARLNKMGSKPRGEKFVMDELSYRFPAHAEKYIREMRTDDMRYGEIAAVLAMSESISGGISDSNIKTILEMRAAKAEWEVIANLHSVPMRDIAVKVYGMSRRVKRALKENPGVADVTETDDDPDPASIDTKQ